MNWWIFHFRRMCDHLISTAYCLFDQFEPCFFWPCYPKPIIIFGGSRPCKICRPVPFNCCQLLSVAGNFCSLWLQRVVGQVVVSSDETSKTDLHSISVVPAAGTQSEFVLLKSCNKRIFWSECCQQWLVMIPRRVKFSGKTHVFVWVIW